MVNCGGGGGVRKQGNGIEEGAHSILSVMALMLVNKQALYICIRA